MPKQTEIHENAARIIRKAADKWPSSFVPRSQVSIFTGGLFTTGTLANRDSKGTGPEESFTLGKKVCYPVDSLCDWLVKELKI